MSTDSTQYILRYEWMDRTSTNEWKKLMGGNMAGINELMKINQISLVSESFQYSYSYANKIHFGEMVLFSINKLI